VNAFLTLIPKIF